jgi:DNA-binding SARP family transcriptional activator
MSVVTVRLFGRFQVEQDGRVLNGWSAHKAQELFAYLLLYRERIHARQVLAGSLWPESTIEQAMKYLRQALWQLQAVVNHNVLEVDAERVCLKPGADLWLDVEEFEYASVNVQGIPGEELDAQGAQLVQEALKVYRGDLLEGSYQDWCLFERERLQRVYLGMLDKQMAYCEAHGEYEAGLNYGDCALRCDVAHERIHRRLMRLHYLAGNRTAALRQYERCVTLLREELGVEPSERTVTLYEQIRTGQLLGHHKAVADGDGKTSMATPSPLGQTLYHLRQIQLTLAAAERQLQETIHTVSAVLNDQG